LDQVVQPEEFLFVLFNSLELTQQNLARIQSVITTYHTQGTLNDAQKTFYEALIAYAKGDIEPFMSSLTALQ